MEVLFEPEMPLRGLDGGIVERDLNLLDRHAAGNLILSLSRTKVPLRLADRT